MNKRVLLFALFAACVASAAPNKPKLVLTVVIDQFRYDYLTRFRSEYSGGLLRLLTQGAVCTNANYQHVPAITAVGHSTVMTGATPSISGIVANDWWDRDEKVKVSSVSDSKTQLLGGAVAAGSSPRRLLVSTIGDELKIAGAGKKPKVFGISLKDRAAILPSGHMADGAFWFDTKSGNFVSSSYYYDALPAWAKEFNAARQVEKYKGLTWMGHRQPNDLLKLYTEVEGTPYGNELIEAFAEKALAAEKLGTREGITDVLTVSFSSNDYVGHRYGPDSQEVHEITLATDKLLDKLFTAVEKQVGAGNYLVVMTADHGVPSMVEANLARKMPGGRIAPAAIKAAVQAALAAKYGKGDWVSGNYDLAVYLNQPLISSLKLDQGEVQKEAGRAILAMGHVARVYTREQVLRGEGLRDTISQKVANGYHPRRGPDVELIPDPYWMVITSLTETTHGTPYSYDTHVPVIFMGAGIKAGQYAMPVAVNDIAPTLASMLEIETPSGSVGRVLTEILVN